MKDLIRKYLLYYFISKPTFDTSPYFIKGEKGGGIEVTDGIDCEAHGLTSLTLEECGSLHPKWKDWSMDKEKTLNRSNGIILPNNNDGYGIYIDKNGQKWLNGDGNYELSTARSELKKENYFDNSNLKDYAVAQRSTDIDKDSDKYFPKGCSYYYPFDKPNNEENWHENMFGKYNKLVYNSAGTKTNSSDYMLLCKNNDSFSKLVSF